jgi:hypothetical protein
MNVLAQHIFRTAICSAAALLAMPGILSAQPSSVDWKFYGGYEGVVSNGRAYCFYDDKGVNRGPDGHIKVWTKCLHQQDLDGVDPASDVGKKIIKSAVEKVAHYYVPPFSAVGKVDAAQSVTIAQYEVTADIGNLQPEASIFHEVNCGDRMMRVLSIFVASRGKSGSTDKPREWQYVPPEGNTANLLTILCPKQ